MTVDFAASPLALPVPLPGDVQSLLRRMAAAEAVDPDDEAAFYAALHASDATRERAGAPGLCGWRTALRRLTGWRGVAP